LSSENTAKNQVYRNEIDGAFIGEFKAPFDGNNASFQSLEWATDGPGNGSWIQLNWQKPVTANQIKLYDRPNFDDNILSGTLQFSDGTTILSPAITSTPVRSGAVGNCFDGWDETTYVSQDSGSPSINEEPCFIQLVFANPVSVSQINTLIGEPGYDHIKFDWWLEAADTMTDLNNKTGTYIKVDGDTRYDISGYWDKISLYNSPLSKKIWKFWVKKTYDDYSTICELELWVS
jgi:hypothetical protein